MYFQGIEVDAGVSIDGNCTMSHVVSRECVEISFGERTGGLNLCLTEDAVVKLVNVATVALADFRRHREHAGCERSDTAAAGDPS